MPNVQVPTHCKPLPSWTHHLTYSVSLIYIYTYIYIYVYIYISIYIYISSSDHRIIWSSYYYISDTFRHIQFFRPILELQDIVKRRPNSNAALLLCTELQLRHHEMFHHQAALVVPSGGWSDERSERLGYPRSIMPIKWGSSWSYQDFLIANENSWQLGLEMPNAAQHAERSRHAGFQWISYFSKGSQNIPEYQVSSHMFV